MVSKKFESVPKGKLVPMYLTEGGELVSLMYKDEEHFNEVCEAITKAVGVLFDGEIALCDEPMDLGYKVQKQEN